MVWRGPMVTQALEQLLRDTNWRDLDYLIVDMPPGTGDIALSLSQYLPRGEVYVVTTPQPAAQKVAALSAASAAAPACAWRRACGAFATSASSPSIQLPTRQAA